MIGRLVNEKLISDPNHNIWGNVLPYMQSTDVNIINFEAALTKNDQAVPKVFNFKADPQFARCLREGNVDIANIANNHCLDYGIDGLIETLEVLKASKIEIVGAGMNNEEAHSGTIFDCKGTKIGVLGFTDNEPEWKATKTRPGTTYIPINSEGAEEVKRDIERIRPHVDLLILSIHWGPNMREAPLPSFQSFAKEMVDAGVDILHGHSAHIFQGVEVIGSSIVLYDTGDFVDDYYVDPILRNDRSFFFVVELSPSGIEALRLYPTLIRNFQANLSEGKEAAETKKRMIHLSKKFGTIFEEEEACLKIRINHPNDN